MTDRFVTWTVSAVADRLGINVPTLRSWDRRYGLGPTHRTVGGHRRYSVGDLVKLQRVQQLINAGTPTAVAAKTVKRNPLTPQSSPHVIDEVIAAFHKSIDALDQPRMSRYARQLLEDLGTERAWTMIFTPALQDAGTRWLTQDTGIACEHLLSTAVMGALSDRAGRAQFGTGSPPDVLLAATDGEEHTLPLFAAASGLAELGLSAFVAGTLPAETLIATTVSLRPRSVLVWARSAETATPELLPRLAALTPVVYAAGMGWSETNPKDITLLRDLPTTLALFGAHLLEPTV